MGLPVRVAATGGIGKDIFGGNASSSLQCTSSQMEREKCGPLK